MNIYLIFLEVYDDLHKLNFDCDLAISRYVVAVPMVKEVSEHSYFLILDFLADFLLGYDSNIVKNIAD